jgi:hypothetical protein
MSDDITQARLARRLDVYQREYTEINARRDSLSRAEWHTVWNIADVARAHSTLTPELVDDVWQELKRLEIATTLPPLSLFP